MSFFERTDASGVLVLAPRDNIAVAASDLPAGTVRDIAGARVVLERKVAIGHKFAIKRIAIEEKSLGAYAKSGQSIIKGIIKPGDVPLAGGLHLLDVVPDGEPRFGFPNISDNAEIAELIACGSHVILFSTGRGSVVGSALAPVIKVCANPQTYKRMSEDMDVDAGRILEGRATLDEVGREIYDLVLRVANGEQTKSEALGHQEFILTYKHFEPLGPACFPSAA